jgi:hypothetical protein
MPVCPQPWVETQSRSSQSRPRPSTPRPPPLRLSRSAKPTRAVADFFARNTRPHPDVDAIKIRSAAFDSDMRLSRRAQWPRNGGWAASPYSPARARQGTRQTPSYGSFPSPDDPIIGPNCRFGSVGSWESGYRLCGLSARLGLIAQNGVGHHGRIQVGADFHDHVAIEAAYSAVAVVEDCAFVRLRGRQQLSDRGVVVHVEVLHF